jgi:hypothetical protein
MPNKCPHCKGLVDNPRYVTCSHCRQKAAAATRRRRDARKDAGKCSICGVAKADDGFIRCLTCREKDRSYRPRRRPEFKHEPRHSVNAKVQIKTEFIELLEGKAAEKGVSKQVLFEELIDKYIEKVVVWT